MKGDIAAAPANATDKARRTLAAEVVEWKLLHLSGTTTAKSTTVVVTIKAKGTG